VVLRIKSCGKIIISLVSLAAFAVAAAIAPVFGADSNDATRSAPLLKTLQKPVFELRFSKEDSVVSPLDSLGFCPVVKKGKASFLVADSTMVVSVSPGTRMLYSLAINPVAVSRMRIVWGTVRFPQGVDWSKAPTRREPIGVALSYGKKLKTTCAETSSITGFLSFAVSLIGRLFSAPFTTVVFLGPPQWHGGKYVGVLFKNRVKYFCLDYTAVDSSGTIVTDLGVDSLYHQAFPKERIRPVNAVSVEADLDGLTDSSCAFIRSITLYGE